MKLLFKPTGNIFTLPDEEAMKIKAGDRGNYEILDCGFNEAETVVTIPQSLVKGIEEAKAESLKQDEEELAKVKDEEAAAPVKKKIKTKRVQD